MNGLSLDYDLTARHDTLSIFIKTKDPMMAARIFALGLVVTVEKGKDELISINYPLGLLEVRKFCIL
jgi:metal-sulfur cluster biosynthetic enzyme